jgi:hypothetical protein
MKNLGIHNNLSKIQALFPDVAKYLEGGRTFVKAFVLVLILPRLLMSGSLRDFRFLIFHFDKKAGLSSLVPAPYRSAQALPQ